MATKTKAERLAEIDAKIAKLQEQRANVAQEPEVDLSSLVGAEVSYKFGRGENRKVYSGTVLAVQGDRIKVQSGEGFDVTIHAIAKGDLVVEGQQNAPAQANPDVPEQPASTQVSEPASTPAEQVQQAATTEAAVNTADEAALRALGLA